MHTTRTFEPDGAASLMPTHVGVVMDGNRRWAREARLPSASDGYRRGADHIDDLLTWCEARGVEHLTVYVWSADTIRKRGEQRLSDFCPWRVAHAEVHVSPTLWPGFTAADFDLALARFSAAKAQAGGDA